VKRKSVFVWGLAALVLLALLLAGTRAWQKRKQQTAPVAVAPAAAELAATDVMTLQPQSMNLGLSLSGTLKAVNSAVIKARVAGELQGLTVREGDAVQAGQVLAQMEPADYRARLQQAQQQAEAARAQLDIAQRQFDNNRALVAQNFISRTALETSQANLEGALANHRAALAAADVARKALDDTTVRSPLSGLVSQRLAQPGERLSVDARILEIVDTRRMELEASVSTAESLQLKIGQRAQLQLEGSTDIWSARLVRINPSAQASSRSVMAYLSVEPGSASGAIRQGLFAQGTLGTGSRQVLAVPVSALRVDKAQPYVQTINQGRVVHQSVTPGERGAVAGEDMVTVDLPAGTQVLRGSVGALRDGLAVRFTQLPSVLPAAAPLAKPAP
jgi:multidrug efflux system membrane fusion protein